MVTEIERKFLVKKKPDLSGVKPIQYERYFLKKEGDFETRIQRKGDFYELEEKSGLGGVAHKTKTKLNPGEFESLKKKAFDPIVRDSYQLPGGVSLKLYHGKYEGLIRAEVEFESVAASKTFKPLEWFGKEITDTPLGRDAQLSSLSVAAFKKLLKELSTANP